MKKDILKIAGVKSEKELYAKYGTEAEFMAKHGGAFKKAAMGAAMVNKQLTQLTDFSNPPQAQGGRELRAANANLRFWEKCGLASSADNGGGGRSGGGGGSDKPSKYKNLYEEISDIKAYEKDERKAFEKSLPEGVDIADWVAMNRDASRMNSLLRNPDYDKYTDEEGVLKPEYQSVATRFDPYYLYYKPAFSGKKEVTPTDILEYQKSQPQGITGYKDLVNRRYMPEKKQDGGYISQAQIGAYIGGEQSSYKPLNYTDLYDKADYANTGMNRQMRMQEANLAAQQTQAANSGKKGGFDLGSLMQSAGTIAQAAEAFKYGGGIRRAQGGVNISMPTDYSQADTDITQQFNKANNANVGDLGTGQKGFLNEVGGITGSIPIVGDLVQGFQDLKKERDLKRQSRQNFLVSGLGKDVAGLTPDIAQRKYDRAENYVGQTNETGQTTGVTPGNQFIAANGARIGGNPTEIQNMYNPGNIYSDMGYEPLSDSIKQYRYGGKAQFGDSIKGGLGKLDASGVGSGQLSQAGNALGSWIGGGKGKPTAGGRIGGTIGSTVGKFIPIPGASQALAFIGSTVGSVLGGKSAKQTEAYQTGTQQNTDDTAFMSGTQGMRNQYNNFMKDGGWISHDWQPQVITQFGGYDMKDLLRDDPTMDTLRAGGHLSYYTPPSEEAMDTAADGAKFTPMWGGDIQPVSHNPYMDGDGYTYEAIGNDHNQSDGRGNTGVGMDYGGSKVEVQPKEPIFETGGEVGPSEKAATVLGGIKVPSFVIPEINEGVSNNKFKIKGGQTFQKYGRDLNALEIKQNKINEKALDAINSIDGYDSYSLLELESAKAKAKGSDMALAIIADQKKKAAYNQAAIHEAKDEMSEILGKPLEVNAFVKGSIKLDKDAMKEAKFGAKLQKAQDGLYGLKPWQGNKYGLGKKTASAYSAQEWENIAKEMGFKGKGNTDFQKFLTDNPNVLPYIINKHKELYGSDVIYDDLLGAAYTGGVKNYLNRVPMQENPIQPIGDIAVKAKEIPGNVKVPPLGKKPSFLNALFSEAAPYLRGSDQERFDYSSIAPEQMALLQNQLEPVAAQTFQPLLEQPYSVSFQDQMNANQADFNALQRQLGGNPAALASLAAQKYAANTGVLGQQFRTNQELQMGAYNRNRSILNDATLKNLAILDQQYGRQSQAKSNTKAQAQAAYASIADKMAKQKLENKTLRTYENLYNFRFGANGQARNVNAPAEFNTDVYASTDNLIPVKNDKGQIVEYKVRNKDIAKNGSLVKAIRNL